MDERERSGRFGHLFSETARATGGWSAYETWRSATAANPDAVSLGVGFPFPDSFPNDELLSAAERTFDGDGDRALQYGGGADAALLPEFVAERARTRGIDCDAEQIELTDGATRAIDAVSHAFLDSGDTLFTEAPTFPGTLAVFRNYGVDIVGCPLDRDGLDVDALERELRERREDGRSLPTLFYTIPTFQNPTGTTLSLERRRRLLELAAEYDFVVLEDDAYGDLRYDGEDVPPLAALDEWGRVVHVGTVSKTVAPGVRIGWVIADEEIVAQVNRTNVGASNTLAQSVVGRYFADGYYEENVSELREAYEKRRDRMLASLEEHLGSTARWIEPEGGFFVWVKLSGEMGVDTDELLSTAAEEGVIYMPGSSFFPVADGENGGEDERSLRLSFSYGSLEEIERGVEALARAVRTVSSPS
ncbi:PLP-dependent aminotransferase family protein [Natronoglomus mannanivorans]|uniref:PLP-dependent aminotransferase family protein n=1 Tax=Natronoglomus mannanivorans TaxID=2979990 RepID=A0AAP3E3E1_9EURY|nr:PLP-dependent aminotransferase family protein [Halobacteria archaeon AArc-xg1-1]